MATDTTNVIQNLLNKKKERQQVSIDSLAQIALQDSIRQDSIRQDSINKARIENLKTYTELSDLEHLDSTYLDKDPVSIKYLGSEWKGEQEENLNNLLSEIITHEANTNVRDDYRRFEALREDIFRIHQPFTPGGVEGYVSGGMGRGVSSYENIMTNPNKMGMNSYFRPANGIDRIWPSDWNMTKAYKQWIDSDVQSTGKITQDKGNLSRNEARHHLYLTEGLGEGNLYEEDLQNLIKGYTESGPHWERANKYDLRSATVNRMIANNQEIRDLILGSMTMDTTDQKNPKVIKTDGFIDILKQFKLNGETDAWESFKESFWSRSNAMKILDNALLAKKRGKGTVKNGEVTYGKMFFNELNPFWRDDIGKEFRDRLDIYPPNTQKQILETLQNIVDDIYTKGLIIEKEGHALMDEFESYAAKFPGRAGLSSNDMSPHKNKDMEKANVLKTQFMHGLDAYKYMSDGEEFDVHGALNNIALEHLNMDLEKLDDAERTKALDEYIIQLTNQGGFQSSY